MRSLIKGSEKMAMPHPPRSNGPKKPHSPSLLKRQVGSSVNHPEQESRDPSGCVEDVVRTVASWNHSPEKLKYKERLNYLGSIKQNVAKVSLNPLEWPRAYLSQPALLSFLRSVVDNCIQQMPTAEIRVAVKEVVEPIDLDTIEDMPFKKHISEWVYGTANFPLCMDCENMLSLHKYFQYALEHMHGGFRKDDPLGVTQPDISASVTTALANVVCCFTNHLRKTRQKYEETFVITMLLPFNYDPDQQAFSTTISAHDAEYCCKKFGHQCRKFFEVIKQHNVQKSQASLFLLALKMHNDLHLPESKMRSCLQCIEKKIGNDIDPQIAEMLRE